MKLSMSESGELGLEGKNWLVHTRNQWAQFVHIKEWNWIDFCFLHATVEWDRALPGFEGEFIILGLGVRFRINGDWKQTEAGRKVEEALNECRTVHSLVDEKNEQILDLTAALMKIRDTECSANDECVAQINDVARETLKRWNKK